MWLWHVGFWEVEDFDKWSWSPSRFRPFFWQTHTNLTHRTYRAVFGEITESLAKEIKAAYHQGYRDAALQFEEMLIEEETDIPIEARYIN